VKTRSSAQIRSHAQKYVIRLCKKFNIKHHINLKDLFCQKNQCDVDNEFLNFLHNHPGDKVSSKDLQKIDILLLKIFKAKNFGGNFNILPGKKPSYS